MDLIKQFDTQVEKFADAYIRKQNIVFGIIFLLIILYASRISPDLPPAVVKVLSNQYFKIFALVLILWVAHVSPSMSILIAVVFLMLMNYVNGKKIWEFLNNVEYLENAEEVEEFEGEEMEEFEGEEVEEFEGEQEVEEFEGYEAFEE
jgi:hypothetical protein